MVYKKCIKRALDIFFALLMLIVLSPVFCVVALLVRFKLGSPIIFKQERPGKDEKIFKMYKFRTMTEKKDAEGNLLPDDQRLTKFGKILRATSMDELPELWNVLKGDMSLVGPRPLLVQYLALYNETQKRRHQVRPGITGYAQVKGRNSISWEKKFELDIFYVDHVSFWMDCKILFMTVVTVFKREGISSQTAATMEVFTGSPEE